MPQLPSFSVQQNCRDSWIFISGKALFSFVVNVCICYSASPSFSPFLYRITKPESLRLETPLLLLEWCLSLRLAYCTKIHNREPDKASIECSKVNECEMLTAQRHLSSSSSRSSQCLWWKRIFDVFIAFWKRTVQVVVCLVVNHSVQAAVCDLQSASFSIGNSWNARDPLEMQPC